MSLWDDYSGSSLNPFNMIKRDDPQKEANRYLSQIPGIGKQYYNPFIQGGQKAGGILEGEYGKLLNPTSFINDIMKNYSESKGAQYEKNELGRGIGATAAAGGFAGTPEHQKEYGKMAEGIMSQDMQQYLQNALGVYGMGLGGERDIYGKGYEASGSLADLLAGNLGAQGGLAFQSASQKNASRDAFMNALMKALSTGAGAAMG
jgi:hypothetical protein